METKQTYQKQNRPNKNKINLPEMVTDPPKIKINLTKTQQTYRKQ